ncbi:MAG: hypothetical protein KJ710_07905 [Candidatus Omnitrophica bacterium]|nr:hypothetical protein [Candidatus Omnitrophota bacterium]MBU1924159.1 hypothetical protein [Candidatus Omnitrophota bacterium]
MADGGFLVKFDGKEAFRCYAVAFDYDEWQVIINNGQEKKELPPRVKSITIKVEG